MRLQDNIHVGQHKINTTQLVNKTKRCGNVEKVARALWKADELDDHWPWIYLEEAVGVNMVMNVVIKVEHGSCVPCTSAGNTTRMDISQSVGVEKSKKLHQHWVKWVMQA